MALYIKKNNKTALLLISIWKIESKGIWCDHNAQRERKKQTKQKQRNYILIYRALANPHDPQGQSV